MKTKKIPALREQGGTQLNFGTSGVITLCSI